MLNLKINACLSNCNTLTITETTGIYDVEDNTGGYGTPNDETSDIESATLDIESLTDNVVYNETIDVTDEIKYSITGEELLTTILNEFEDGRYCITYKVVMTNGNTYVSTYKLYVYCNIECCANSYALSLVELTCNPCDNVDAIISKLLTMNTFLTSLMSAEAVGNDCAFENILLRLQWLCEGGDYNYKIKPCNC